MTLDKNFLSKDVEQKIYQAWEKSKAFQAGRRRAAQPYTLMMPPPNVTGTLHMGHALTYTLQDILVRYYRMRGRDVLWQPGLDHAGIATQLVVERQLAREGMRRQELGREKFTEHVWAWKDKFGGGILDQQRRLGLSAHWERGRFTLDEGLSQAVCHVFVRLYRDGLIYRAKRLVNWNPHLLTAVSDLEVKSIETQGKLYFIRYPLENSAEFICVATTRPETLFGDTAIAVHPDDSRYGSLVGRRASVPFQGRSIPIIADAYCDPDKGSGAVKITPAHDFNDFEVGQRHHLEMISIFDEKAHLNACVPPEFQGLERFEAREKIVRRLDAEGLLEKIEDILHMVPHGERLDAILEPRLTDQWFVDAQALAGPALEAVETGKTRIVPQQWKATYDQWLTHIEPWCISRQLWWGHRIPAWYGPDNHIFVALTEEEAQAEATHHYGHSVSLRQEDDVLDTWFSSALWPFSTLGWPEETPDLKRYYPTDVLVTGLDILFFWVARMMMMGLYFTKEVPFKTVYLHTLVRDAQGQKMSKSKGNVLDPLELMDVYGTDALRFSMAALAAPGRDVKFSPAIIEGYRNFVTKIWNAARFCIHNDCFYEAHFEALSCVSPVNRWMVGSLLTLTRTLESDFEEYRFHTAASALYQGIWGQFCDWYLELIKPVLLGDEADLKQETQRCAGWCMGILTHLLHPFMPFVTEEIWAHLSRSAEMEAEDRENTEMMLVTAPWPFQEDQMTLVEKEAWRLLRDDPAQKDLSWVIDMITALRGMRSDFNLSPSLQVHLGLAEGSPDIRRRFQAYQLFLERLGRVSSFEENQTGVKAIPKGSVRLIVGQGVFYVPLDHVVDLTQECQRLEEARRKAQAEKESVEQNLRNADFMARAPAEIVDKNRARLEDLQKTCDRYTVALASLRE